MGYSSLNPELLHKFSSVQKLKSLKGLIIDLFSIYFRIKLKWVLYVTAAFFFLLEQLIYMW